MHPRTTLPTPRTRRALRLAAALVPPALVVALAVVTTGRTAAHVRITTDITWSEDIRPILRERCMRCHRPGGIAPSYADLTVYGTDSQPGARAWAQAIEEEILTGRMPPWDADPRYGRFANERRLSQEEVDKIVAWVEGGAPQGPRRNLPPPPELSGEWILGEPDLALQLAEPNVVPAGEAAATFQATLPVDLAEPTWITGFELRSEQPQAAYRIAAWIVDPPGEPEPIEVEVQVPYDPFADEEAEPPTRTVELRRGRRFLGQWLRGDAPVLLPVGAGKRLLPGSTVELEVEYRRPEREGAEDEIRDRARLGLYLAQTPDEVDLIVDASSLGEPSRRIAKRELRRGVTESLTLSENARLVALAPHLGDAVESFEVRAVYPDGRARTLVYVPAHRPEWPASYVLEEPLDAPAGTELQLLASFRDDAGAEAAVPLEVLVDWALDDHIALPEAAERPVTTSSQPSGGMLVGALPGERPSATAGGEGGTSAPLDPADPNAAAHMDHSPLHGGQFFMAPNSYHHLEGALPQPGVFRVYVYDDFKRPVDPRNFAGRVVFERFDQKTGDFSEEEFPMAPVPGSEYLEARISDEMPAEFYASLWLGGEQHRFDFYFDEPTVAPPTPPRQVAVLGQHSHLRPPLSIPKDPAAIVRELEVRARQVEEKIETGDWIRIYVPAFDGRDLAEALLDHAGALAGRERGQARIAVSRVMQSAAELDRAGDLGDPSRAREALARFRSGVEDLTAVFAAGAGR
jgi:hypothetical protein